MAKKSLAKRPQHRQALNSKNVKIPPAKKTKAKDSAHVPINTPNRHPNGREGGGGGGTTIASTSTPSSSKWHDATISHEEFEEFKSLVSKHLNHAFTGLTSYFWNYTNVATKQPQVREDFHDTKNMMQENFKAILQEIRINKADDKVHTQSDKN